MISKKISLLAIGFNYREINQIQDELSNDFSNIHFDFAISIRDSLYRINLTDYDILLLDLTSAETDTITALQEVYQKSRGIPTVITINSEDITTITDAFGVRSHYYIIKNLNYLETMAASISQILSNQVKNMNNDIKLTPKNLPIFQNLINTVHDEVLIIDLEYRIKMINAKLVEKFNCTAEDVIGKKCYELLYNFNVPCHEKNLTCPLKTVMSTNSACKVMHSHHNIAANQLTQVNISAIPLMNNLNIFEDVLIAINEERISLATTFNKTLLEELVNGLTEGLLFSDAQNNIVFLNQAAENLLNIEKAKLIGKSIFELPLGDGSHWLDNILQNSQSQKHLSKSEKFRIHQKWFTLRFIPLFENDKTYIGGFLYLTEKPQEAINVGFDTDFISVSKLFNAKIVAEG